MSADKGLKLQLREARDLLLEAEDMMMPAPEHHDQPLRAAEAGSRPAATAGATANAAA